MFRWALPLRINLALLYLELAIDSVNASMRVSVILNSLRSKLRKVIVKEDVIGAFAALPPRFGALENNLARREFHADFRSLPLLRDCGRNVVELNVLF